MWVKTQELETNFNTSRSIEYPGGGVGWVLMTLVKSAGQGASSVPNFGASVLLIFCKKAKHVSRDGNYSSQCLKGMAARSSKWKRKSKVYSPFCQATCSPHNMGTQSYILTRDKKALQNSIIKFNGLVEQQTTVYSLWPSHLISMDFGMQMVMQNVSQVAFLLHCWELNVNVKVMFVHSWAFLSEQGILGNDIRVSPKMFFDHLPWRYDYRVFPLLGNDIRVSPKIFGFHLQYWFNFQIPEAVSIDLTQKKLSGKIPSEQCNISSLNQSNLILQSRCIVLSKD
ncbi:hypothetical protein DITRI_Ditri17bG0022500 [Diplodiscus trichospermus]